MRGIRTVLKLQLLILLLAMLMAAGVMKSVNTGCFVGLGGMIAWIPTACFTWFFFRPGRTNSRQIVMAFYGAEGLKFFLTLLLWGVAWIAVPQMDQHMGAVFLGLITVLLSHGVSLILK